MKWLLRWRPAPHWGWSQLEWRDEAPARAELAEMPARHLWANNAEAHLYRDGVEVDSWYSRNQARVAA